MLMEFKLKFCLKYICANGCVGLEMSDNFGGLILLVFVTSLIQIRLLI
jgi:hypothetical protein